MARNLEATRGLVYSQAVLLALAEHGHTREHAYRIVQRNALAAWDEGGTLFDRLAADPECDLGDDDLAACFTMNRFLKNTGGVFDQLERLML